MLSLKTSSPVSSDLGLSPVSFDTPSASSSPVVYDLGQVLVEETARKGKPSPFSDQGSRGLLAEPESNSRCRPTVECHFFSETRITALPIRGVPTALGTPRAQRRSGSAGCLSQSSTRCLSISILC